MSPKATKMPMSTPGSGVAPEKPPRNCETNLETEVAPVTKPTIVASPEMIPIQLDAIGMREDFATVNSRFGWSPSANPVMTIPEFPSPIWIPPRPIIGPCASPPHVDLLPVAVFVARRVAGTIDHVDPSFTPWLMFQPTVVSATDTAGLGQAAKGSGVST
jgi:hypothetical protein